MKHSPRLQTDKVIEVILACHGLIGPCAERLGVTRSRLRQFVQVHPTCSRALSEAREGLVDLAEQRLYDLVEARDYRAISFVLMTLGKSRGWVLPKGTPVDQSTNTTVIESVNIIAVPRGRFLPKEPDADMPGVRISNPPSLTVVRNEDDPETLQ